VAHATRVFPEPVAIWISDFGRFSARDASSLDGLDLYPPQAVSVELGELPQPLAELAVQLGETPQLFRTMECEDPSASGVGIQAVGELRLHTRALVVERQRAGIDGDVLGEAIEILQRLDFDSGEGVTLRLGLNGPQGLAVDVEQVVGVTGGQRELADGDAGRGRDVHLLEVLDDPARRRELLVNLQPGFVFRLHAAPPGALSSLSVLG